MILERASDIGGVWRDNTYPGAACDVVSRFYSFSYDQDHGWSPAFAPQPEIWDYALKVVDRHGIRPHVRFNTEVTKARSSKATGLWTVETATGDTFTTPVLVSAVGLFNHANIPDFPGRDDFKGVDVPLLAMEPRLLAEGKDCRHRLWRERGAVHSEDRVAGRKARTFPALAAIRDAESIFFPAPANLTCGCKSSRAARAGAAENLSDVRAFHLRRRLSAQPAAQGRGGVSQLARNQVKDPELRRKLTPNYPMGCKRQLVSDLWYDAMTRPNVEVEIKPIERIEPEGSGPATASCRPVSTPSSTAPASRRRPF